MRKHKLKINLDKKMITNIFLMFSFILLISLNISNANACCEFRLYTLRNVDLYFVITKENINT